MANGSEYTKDWITQNSIKILETYSSGITVRQLYYRLVALGMTNDIKHYKKVVSAMTDARWDGLVDFEGITAHPCIGYNPYRPLQYCLTHAVQWLKRRFL